MSIAKIYSQVAITIQKDAPLQHAAHLMRDISVSDVIVVSEDEQGREMPIGILTDRDIVIKVLGEDVDVSLLKVEDVMRSDIISIYENEDIVKCLELLNQYKLNRAPVVDAQGYIKGVISTTDLLLYTHNIFTDLVKILKPF